MEKPKTYTSPFGKAIYPHLSKADVRFKPEGEYHVDLEVNAEKALEKIGKKIHNLDHIRSLFLDHPVEDFDPEWQNPDGSSVISFLCNNYSFNKSRVEKALEKYVHARNPSRQLTLGDF